MCFLSLLCASVQNSVATMNSSFQDFNFTHFRHQYNRIATLTFKADNLRLPF